MQYEHGGATAIMVHMFLATDDAPSHLNHIRVIRGDISKDQTQSKGSYVPQLGEVFVRTSRWFVPDTPTVRFPNYRLSTASMYQ